MFNRKIYLLTALLAVVFGFGFAERAWSQRGRAAAGRAAGNHAPAAAVNHGGGGPAMTRPTPAANHAPANVKPNVPSRPNVGDGKPNLPNVGGGNIPNRPNVGGGGGNIPNRPNVGDNKPNLPNRNQNGNAGSKVPEGFHRPSAGGNTPSRPSVGGGIAGIGDKVPSPNRPGNIPKPGGGASSGQVNDFLGLGGKEKPGGMMRPGAGNPVQPGIGKDKLPGKDTIAGIKDKRPGEENNNGIKDKLPGKDAVGGVKDRLPDNKKPNVTVGNVNVGNSIDYKKDNKAWVNNRHDTGNRVRLNAGDRYYGSYTSGLYRRGVIGGYPYYRGWANRGPFYGWRPVTYVAFGAFMGAAWTSPQPIYYAYGDGGNIYYENQTVYIDGTAAGTAEEYSQQVQTLAASAPETTNDATEWLPLGTFAVSREDVDDTQSMIELAVNKDGVIAGTYYNEAAGVSRSIKGMVDKTTQRVAMQFADNKNNDTVLETGIYNLTQDEAPCLLHIGKSDSTPILLVRLQPPEGDGK